MRIWGRYSASRFELGAGADTVGPVEALHADPLAPLLVRVAQGGFCRGARVRLDHGERAGELGRRDAEAERPGLYGNVHAPSRRTVIGHSANGAPMGRPLLARSDQPHPIE